VKLFIYFILVVINSGHYCQANDQVITYAKPESIIDQRHKYFVKLLKLALSKTNSQLSTIRLKTTTEPMQQGRAIQELILQRHVDLVWTVTSQAREQQLLPIRIPLLKGLLGYRVAIIRTADQEKFARVTSIKTLRKYIAGQGHDWPDTKILSANGINVVTSSTYEGLFAMLKMKRFDFFPRGITEAWQEVVMQRDAELMVDESILLYYPSPIYFFVNKKSTILAKRIEKGLQIAISDGSFEQLFYAYPEHKKVFASVRIKQRKIITLHNPLLSPFTPLDNQDLWFQFK